MTVQEFYDLGRIVFNKLKIDALVPNLLNDTDIQVLNALFESKFSSCELGEEDGEYNESYAANIIFKNRYLYEGIKKALEKQFDPLNAVDIIDSTEYRGSVENEKQGKEKSTRTPNLEEHSTRTPNLTQETSNGSYIENQDVTFEDKQLSTHEKQINGGKDTITNKGTEDNSRTMHGNETNEIEFINRKDVTSFVGREDVKTRIGHEAIDYRKAIEDYYETKRVNLFEIILNDVADEIVIPIYTFD